MITHPAPLLPENFRALVEERIHDEALRRNIRRATLTSLRKRDAVVEERADWQEMRRRAREIKAGVMDDLAAQLDAFERRATRNGSRVLWARDGQEACAVIGEIIREHGARRVVKSKSMTTEEIGLGHALEAMGVDAVETDLGEYIVQLAGEMPSHITAPALHKSRADIGALFAARLGVPFTTDPGELTAIARTVLREKFLSAEIGISGVNFGVVETGAMCIVENEGNARLCTTLPRVHIAVMGIEKLVPDHESLALYLSMLARSATGQRLSCYTSIIAGPRRAGESDGPVEQYIILLDNGRSRLLADPVLREALYCIRCGACMNTCPVYQTIGGHGYGSIYPGPIGSVLTPVFAGEDRAKALPYASSLCGACAEICPVGIDIHHLLLYHRRNIAGRGTGPAFERFAMRVFSMIARSPAAYRIAAALGRVYATLSSASTGWMHVPVWSKSREMPPFAARSFHDAWKERQRERA